MKKFLVGGAVRDKLMGIEPKDRDYVVVGSTPTEMLNAGFKQVGADFPVFLHPVTGEEYALARTERKVGSGYKGFETDFNPNVTLEEDLIRRDLTINSMAMDDEGNLIDPFNGAQDLKDGILRATSEAFKEDPLRVLRIARFAARYDFEIEESKTFWMCYDIVQTDEFKNLTPERVGVELVKVLETNHPERFFWKLWEFGALEVFFPELEALHGQTQPALHHPEGDAFVHTMLVLKEAVKANLNVVERFAALVHDLGKGLTPKDKLPAHHGHEGAGVPLVDALCDRIVLSNEFRKNGKIAARFHTHVHRIFDMKESTIVRLFNDLEADHTQEFAVMLANVSKCDKLGRGEFLMNKPYPERDHFVGLMNAISSVKVRDLFTPEELRKPNVNVIKDRLNRARMKKVKEFSK